MNKRETAKYVVWVIVTAAVVTGAVYTTNFLRDYQVYQATAMRCNGDKAILSQEVEQKAAEIERLNGSVDELKNLPVR